MELTIPGVDFAIPLNVVILGTVTGLTYSLIAVGLTLVYKSTRVLNLAAGEIGALPALFVPWLVLQNAWPYWVALPLALVGSLAVGGLTEFLVIRRLGQAPRLTVMVATIGLAQSLFALGVLLPDAGQLTGRRYPTPFDWSLTIGDLILGPGQLLRLIVAPLSVLALSLFLRRSRIGRASRAAAENMEAARLAGVPTVRIQFVVWSIAGLLAGIGAILIGPTRPLALSSALGPSLLLRALGAAMIGGLVSIPGAFAGGIVIGITEALVLWNYPTGGTLELVIAGFIVVSLLARRSLGRTIRGRDATGWTYARSVRPLPANLARNPRVRAARWSILAIVLFVAAGAPLVLTPSNQFMASNVVLFAMMGLSLVVLTGYAGHVSLGQFGFVGIGAGLGGLLLQREWSYPIVALAVVLAGLGVAFIVGLPALRVRGLFLAVTTLGFALVVANWLFAQRWFVQTKMGFGSSLHIDRPEMFGIDFNTERNYYWLCLSVLIVLSTVVYGMRRGGVGRSMIAVRENEASAASLSLAPARVKLTAFMLSGTIAALAGYLYGTLVINFSSNPRDTFGPTQSLELVVTAVFGGVTTITGIVLGAAWVEGIPRLLGEDYALLTSGFALILIIVLLPGGLASLVFDIRDRFVSWLVHAPLPKVLRPLGAPEVESPVEHEMELAHELAVVSAAATAQWARPHARERAPVPVPLLAQNITVNFGGLKALDDVTIEVRQGEILGLMGPNGAGKTTLFDVLTGAVRPTSGRVLLDELDVTRMAVHRRARLGLGRTYQQALLFGDLTLLESVKVSLERTLPTHTLPALVGFPTSLRRERRRTLRATEIVELLDLGEYAHRSMTELPTGIRRLAELGCVIGLDAHVLLLDEPTAGFTAREIEAFTRIVRNVREYLGATIVVIDHDVPMMRSLVERLYVLASGELIAEGAPSLLESHDTVADAYLGGRRNTQSVATPT